MNKDDGGCAPLRIKNRRIDFPWVNQGCGQCAGCNHFMAYCLVFVVLNNEQEMFFIGVQRLMDRA